MILLSSGCAATGADLCTLTRALCLTPYALRLTPYALRLTPHDQPLTPHGCTVGGCGVFVFNIC